MFTTALTALHNKFIECAYLYLHKNYIPYAVR